MSVTGNAMQMRVTGKRILTPAICEFTFASHDAGPLPEFIPGAHITVETPSGAMRRYSLVNNGETPDRYVIAVKCEPASRGGSRSMHEQVEIDTVLNIQPPENSFPLGDAPRYLLIAGGIGVTPIYAMAKHLAKRGKPFQVIYCTRSAEETAYLDEMNIAFSSALQVHHDFGDPNKVYDFWDHFAEPQATYVCCCGPKPLMDEIKAISGHWPEGRVNFEDFKPVEVVRPNDTAFDVTLKKSGRTITVPADRTILETLREAGLKVASSCESGTCGSCKSGLIAGDVDHRDMVLMEDEKLTRIMICVSRAHSGRLVLDL